MGGFGFGMGGFGGAEEGLGDGVAEGLVTLLLSPRGQK